jgi:hypothetical protein
MVSRPLASMADSAPRACSGSASRTLPAAPAWMVITLTWWLTTSCNSPAMRARSCATASRVAASCSRSSASARWSDARARPRAARIARPSKPIGSRITNTPALAGSRGQVLSWRLAMTVATVSRTLIDSSAERP